MNPKSEVYLLTTHEGYFHKYITYMDFSYNTGDLNNFSSYYLDQSLIPNLGTIFIARTHFCLHALLGVWEIKVCSDPAALRKA